MVKCAAILLAAGKATRMGCLKALLPWRGTTLLQYQVAQFTQSSVDQLVIVLGYQSSKLLPLLEKSSAHLVWNEQYEKGKTESIKKGMQFLESSTDCFFVASVDQPVSKRVIDKMIRHFTHTKRKIIIPVAKGKRGHPALFSVELLGELFQINEDTQGLKDIIARRKTDISELEVKDCTVLFNFNSPKDYEAGVCEGRAIKNENF